jgi:hypothetical protein
MSYAIGKIQKSKDDLTNYGTAFAISAEQGLTAFHCIGDRATGAITLPTIYLSFPGGAGIEATVVDGDAKADFALLRFTQSLPGDLQTVPLVPDADPHDPFRCMGYPDVPGVDLTTSQGEIANPDGRIFDGIPAIQLFSKEAAASLSLYGMSGAPVLIGTTEAAVGIIRWNPPSEHDPELATGGVVFACPTRSVIQARPELKPFVIHRAPSDRVLMEEIHEKTVALFDLRAAESQDQQKKDYERDYLKQVATKSERLDTLGVSDLRSFRQRLTISYVSLFVKSTKNGSDATRLRAEEVLKANPLLAIRAPAGAGKTTLLNWIALACAQGADAASNSQWQGGVPFLIPLRTLTDDDKGKPHIARLVDYTVDLESWPRQPPPEWIIQVLNAGRAVVMLDGVDELPAKFRSNFWSWVNEALLWRYPGNRIVITSRYLPQRRTDEWQPPSGFAAADLDEMTDEDVRQFVRQWHESALVDEADAEVRGKLAKARESLPQKLFDPVNRRVRDLCGTPLLAAMICALHWREEGYLPAQRIELYERCVSMLIEERDYKRGIGQPPEPLRWMTADDKEMVLQRLAYTMMKNVVGGEEGQARIEVAKNQAAGWIADWVPIFKDERARRCQPLEVLDHLLERTGLLREPAIGTVEYTHRTFQEYLAACASGALNVAGELANLAFDDQWHETIVMAAGTKAGGVPFGKHLIEELLKRGERKSWFRSGKANEVSQTCLALAIACLETAKQADHGLRSRVLSHLAEIVPPRNAAAAKSLAAAGEAALTFLTYSKCKDQDDETVAACARAVRLIAGALAAQILGDYANDERESVLVEVARSSTSNVLRFTSTRAKLLAGSPIPESFREFVMDLDPVGRLTDLTSLNLVFCRRIQDLTPLRELPNLTSLDLSFCDGVKDLTPLRGLTNLTSLDLSACAGVQDLTPLGGLTKLASLNLSFCAGVQDLTRLGGLTNLTSLDLTRCRKIQDLRALSGLSNLTSLDLRGCDGIQDLTALSGLSNLTSLTLMLCDGIQDLRPLSGLMNLDTLNLVGCGNIRDLTPLVGLRQLSLIWLDKRLKSLAPDALEGKIRAPLRYALFDRLRDRFS